jgi:hypothetical protein
VVLWDPSAILNPSAGKAPSLAKMQKHTGAVCEAGAHRRRCGAPRRGQRRRSALLPCRRDTPHAAHAGLRMGSTVMHPHPTHPTHRSRAWSSTRSALTCWHQVLRTATCASGTSRSRRRRPCTPRSRQARERACIVACVCALGLCPLPGWGAAGVLVWSACTRVARRLWAIATGPLPPPVPKDVHTHAHAGAGRLRPRR